MMRLSLPAAAALMLGACSLPGLGGGSDMPATLTTLATSVPPPADTVTRTRAVLFDTPLTPVAINTPRVAAVRGGTAIAYIEDLRLVDTPDRLFQQLLSETTYRRTNLLTVDPRQSGIVPALRVTGRLHRFEFDADTSEVVVVYEALWTRDELTGTRRFEAREPAVGYAADIGPALNAASNRVAVDVADWIAGS